MSPQTNPQLETIEEEARLIARMATGDLDGLGTLFDRYGDHVRRFVLRLGVRDTDADDLVQNTFLGALRSASRFDPQCAVRPWLFGIAAMLVRRYRHSAARLAARFRDWTEEPLQSQLPAPDGLAQQRQERAHLAQAIEHLSSEKREAFTLVVVEGLSGEQAALALGVPVNTIWTRLHRARRDLRKYLERQQAREVAL